jgi:CelD/BcsL family acetyltransferase involved in cellulose biosynthesis
MPHGTVELAAEALPRRHAVIAVDTPAVASRPGDLSIEICASMAGLEALAPAWQDLLDRCGDANPFITPAWHLAWWRTFGAGKLPHIVAFRDGERLAAVLPLLERRERLRRLPVRVLGSCDNDHASRTGMVVEPGREAVVAAALARHLAASSARWDVLMLRQLPAHAAWIPRFVSACSAEGLAVFGPTPAAGRCVLPLSGTWEAYLATQSGHFRQRLKELGRRVERHGAATCSSSSMGG